MTMRGKRVEPWFATELAAKSNRVRPGCLNYGAVPDRDYPAFPTTRQTDLALDLAGVFKYYPSHPARLRFGLGPSAVFYGPARSVAPPVSPFYGSFVDPGFGNNRLQFTIGFGWRFQAR